MRSSSCRCEPLRVARELVVGRAEQRASRSSTAYSKTRVGRPETLETPRSPPGPAAWRGKVGTRARSGRCARETPRRTGGADPRQAVRGQEVGFRRCPPLMPQCQRRDRRGALKQRERRRAPARHSGGSPRRDRRVVAPIDPDRREQRMRRVSRAAHPARARPWRPRASRRFPASRGSSRNSCRRRHRGGAVRRVRAPPRASLELRRGRIGLFRRCDVEQRELIAHAAIVACGATAVWSSVGARAVDRALQLP